MRFTSFVNTATALLFIVALASNAQQNNQPASSNTNRVTSAPPANATPGLNSTIAGNGTMAGNGTTVNGTVVNGTAGPTTTTPTTLPTASALSTGALAGTVAAIAPGQPGVAAGPDDTFIAAAARNVAAGSAMVIALGVGGWLLI